MTRPRLRCEVLNGPWLQAYEAIISSILPERNSRLDASDDSSLLNGFVLGFISPEKLDLIKFGAKFLEDKYRFSDWFAEIAILAETMEGESLRDKLIAALRLDLADSGFPHVWTMPDQTGILYANQFQNQVLTPVVPFIEGSDMRSAPHGDLSHLIQWAYVARVLKEAYSDRVHEFFNYVCRDYGYTDLWNDLFDRVHGFNLRNAKIVTDLLDPYLGLR